MFRNQIPRTAIRIRHHRFADSLLATASPLKVRMVSSPAAIKPLLEHVMAQDSDAPCSLIWIASDTISHYRHNLCRSWSDAFDNIRYRPLGDIEDFNSTVVNDWGLKQSGATIYISGDSRLNRIVTQVLESAAVPGSSIFTDITDAQK